MRLPGEAWHMTNLELGRGSAGVDLALEVFRDAMFRSVDVCWGLEAEELHRCIG